jgi:hypothetical protein
MISGADTVIELACALSLNKILYAIAYCSWIQVPCAAKACISIAPLKSTGIGSCPCPYFHSNSIIRTAGPNSTSIRWYRYRCRIPHISPPVSVSSWTPRIFYTYFYNRARRLRLEKLLLLYLELSSSSNGRFNNFWIQVAVSLLKPPHGGFRSEMTATYRSEVKLLQIYNGYM